MTIQAEFPFSAICRQTGHLWSRKTRTTDPANTNPVFSRSEHNQDFVKTSKRPKPATKKHEHAKDRSVPTLQQAAQVHGIKADHHVPIMQGVSACARFDDPTRGTNTGTANHTTSNRGPYRIALGTTTQTTAKENTNQAYSDAPGNYLLHLGTVGANCSMVLAFHILRLLAHR